MSETLRDAPGDDAPLIEWVRWYGDWLVAVGRLDAASAVNAVALKMTGTEHDARPMLPLPIHHDGIPVPSTMAGRVATVLAMAEAKLLAPHDVADLLDGSAGQETPK